MIISKAKGPAEAATSPSHGSTNPEKDKEMNRSDNTTAVPEIARDFPIPYPSTAPNDDLFSARSLLHVVRDALMRASCSQFGMSKGDASDMVQVTSVIAGLLETVQRLLDDEAVPCLTKEYLRVRREEIVERWGARS